MAVELPEPLQWVLLLLAGCRWPEADEDQLRDMADHCRKAAEALADAAQAGDATIKRALEGQQGVAAEALGTYWEKYSVGKGTEQDPGYLPGAINALNGMGDMLEQVANSAETAKIQIIAQLGILAFEIATAEAEAPFTGGLSMLEVPGFIAASKATVSATLKLLLKEMLVMAAKQAAQMAAINLLAQGIELAEGHRKSIDMKEVGQNAAGGAVGGASGHLIGKGIGKAGEKLGVEAALKSTAGKMATGAAVGVGADVSTQLITTGKVDGSSLLGSGLSGGAGAGLHAGAAKAKGHFVTPKAAEGPKLPGTNGGSDGATPTFNKPDTAGASSYHGPSGSAGAGAAKTADSGAGASSSGSGASASGASRGADSGAGAGSGSGESKVSGLTPFGGGRGASEASPSAGHTAAPGSAPSEQAAAHVQEAAAPRAESRSAAPVQETAAPRQEPVVPPTRESVTPRESVSRQEPVPALHEQAVPRETAASSTTSMAPESVPRQESVPPTRESVTPRADSQPPAPVHEQSVPRSESQAAAPVNESVPRQGTGAPVHEQVPREAVVSSATSSVHESASRQESAPALHESGQAQAAVRESVPPTRESLTPRAESQPPAPVHESVPSVHEQATPRSESQAAAPVNESVPRQGTGAPVHEQAVPREAVVSSATSSVHESVPRQESAPASHESGQAQAVVRESVPPVREEAVPRSESQPAAAAHTAAPLPESAAQRGRVEAANESVLRAAPAHESVPASYEPAPGSDPREPRPSGAGVMPNISGVLGGAGHLAAGGTSLDGGTRLSAGPAPARVAEQAPGQVVPDGPASDTPAQNPAAGAPMAGGFAPGPVGGHTGTGAVPRPATPAAAAPAGGTIRPGAGRVGESAARPVTEQTHDQLLDRRRQERQTELDRLGRAGSVRDAVEQLGGTRRNVSRVRPADADRLRQDLPGMTPEQRAQEIANLRPEHRRWLAQDPRFVDALKSSLPPKDFAKVAAELIVHVDPRAEQAASARLEAQRQVARMLQDPDTAAQLMKNGADVVIVPKDVRMPDVPDLHDLRGLTVDSEAGGGRGYDDMRGSGGRHSAVTEENLLGERTSVGAGGHYADGYSTTTHEFSHTVHEFGLSDHDKQTIKDAFEKKTDAAKDPAKNVQWPDGRTPGNYSSKDQHEYFAQATNAYLGTNHGRDPYTGEPRNNGAEWVKRNEPDLYPLLEKLYGPDPSALHDGAANPVRETTAQNAAYDGFREFMEQVDGTPQPTAEPRPQPAVEHRPPAAEPRRSNEQLPSPPPPPPTGAHGGTTVPAATDRESGHRIDGKHTFDTIEKFLGDSAEFRQMRPDLERYERDVLNDKDTKALLKQNRNEKFLHADVLSRNADRLTDSVARAEEQLEVLRQEESTGRPTPERSAQIAAERAKLESLRDGAQAQRDRSAIFEHELRRGVPAEAAPFLRDRQEAEIRVLPKTIERIKAAEAHTAELVARAETGGMPESRKTELESRQQRLKEAREAREQALKDAEAAVQAGPPSAGSPRPGGVEKPQDAGQWKNLEDSYRVAFEHAGSELIDGQPHAEKVMREAEGETEVKLSDVSINRNHVIADYMVHKYVTAAVFKARSLDEGSHRAASDAFGDFVSAMAPDRHRVYDTSGAKAASNFDRDTVGEAVVVSRDLAATPATVDLRGTYGKDLADALDTRTFGDRDSAAAAAQQLNRELARIGLDETARPELDRLAAAVAGVHADRPTAQQLTAVHDAVGAVRDRVKERAVDDLALVNGITGPQKIDDASAVLRAAADGRGGPRTPEEQRRLAGQLDDLAGHLERAGKDPKALRDLARDLLDPTVPVARDRYGKIAEQLAAGRAAVRESEVRQRLSELVDVPVPGKAQPVEMTPKERRDEAKAAGRLQELRQKLADASTASADADAAHATARRKAEDSARAAEAATDRAEKARATRAAAEDAKAERKAGAEAVKKREERMKAQAKLAADEQQADDKAAVRERAKQVYQQEQPAPANATAKKAAQQRAWLAGDLELMGRQYGGAYARAGAGGNHPAAIFDRALTARVEDVPGMIKEISDSLSNSASNLRFGDDRINQWIQNFLDPHVIRDPEVLTAVAHGQLPPEALYAPHTADLLQAVRSLEANGLVPAELRDIMAPKTQGDLARALEDRDPSLSSRIIAHDLGVPSAHADRVPVSSSGDHAARADGTRLTDQQLAGLHPEGLYQPDLVRPPVADTDVAVTDAGRPDGNAQPPDAAQTAGRRRRRDDGDSDSEGDPGPSPARRRLAGPDPAGPPLPPPPPPLSSGHGAGTGNGTRGFGSSYAPPPPPPPSGPVGRGGSTGRHVEPMDIDVPRPTDRRGADVEPMDVDTPGEPQPRNERKRGRDEDGVALRRDDSASEGPQAKRQRTPGYENTDAVMHDRGYQAVGPAHELTGSLVNYLGGAAKLHPPMSNSLLGHVNPHGAPARPVDGFRPGSDLNACFENVEAYRDTHFGRPRVSGQTLNGTVEPIPGNVLWKRHDGPALFGQGADAVKKLMRTVQAGGRGSFATVLGAGPTGAGHAVALVHDRDGTLRWADLTDRRVFPATGGMPYSFGRDWTVWASVADPRENNISGPHDPDFMARYSTFTRPEQPHDTAEPMDVDDAFGATRTASTGSDRPVELPPPGRRVPVAGDGYCLLRAVAVGEPGLGGPERLQAEVGRYFEQLGPENWPTEVVANYRNNQLLREDLPAADLLAYLPTEDQAAFRGLPVDELRDTIGRHLNDNPPPPSAHERALLLRTVPEWNTNWRLTGGEMLPAATAHALGLRLRVVDHDGTTQAVFGPADGRPVTVYRADDHYDGSEPTPSTSPADHAPPTDRTPPTEHTPPTEPTPEAAHTPVAEPAPTPPRDASAPRPIAGTDLVVGLTGNGQAVRDKVVEAIVQAAPGDRAAARAFAEAHFGAATLRPMLGALSRGEVWTAPFDAHGWSGSVKLTGEVTGSTRLRTEKIEFENGADRTVATATNRDVQWEFNAGVQARQARDVGEPSELVAYYHARGHGEVNVDLGGMVARSKTSGPAEVFGSTMRLELDFGDLRHHGEPVGTGSAGRTEAVDLDLTVAVPERTDSTGGEQRVPPQRLLDGRVGGQEIVLDLAPRDAGQRRPPVEALLDRVEAAAREEFGGDWPALREKVLAEVDFARLQRDLKSMTAGEPVSVTLADRRGGRLGTVEITARVGKLRQAGTTKETEFTIGTTVQQVRSTAASRGNAAQLGLSGAVKPGGGLLGGGGAGRFGGERVDIRGDARTSQLTSKSKVPGVVFEGAVHFELSFNGKSVAHEAGSADVRLLVDRADTTPETPARSDGEPAAAEREVAGPPDSVWRGGDDRGGLGESVVVRDVESTAALRSALDTGGRARFGGEWDSVREQVMQAFGRPNLAARLTGMTRGEALEVRIPGKEGLVVTAVARVEAMTYRRADGKAEINTVNETSAFTVDRRLRTRTAVEQGQAGGAVAKGTPGVELGATASGQQRRRAGGQGRQADRVYAGGKYSAPQVIYGAELVVDLRLGRPGEAGGAVRPDVSVPLRAEVGLDARDTVKASPEAGTRFQPPSQKPESSPSPAVEATHTAPRRMRERGELNASYVVHGLSGADKVRAAVEDAVRARHGEPSEQVRQRLGASFDRLALKAQLSRLTRGGRISETVSGRTWSAEVTVTAELGASTYHAQAEKYEFESGTRTSSGQGNLSDRRSRLVGGGQVKAKAPLVDVTGGYAHRTDRGDGQATETVGSASNRGKHVEPAVFFDVATPYQVRVAFKRLGMPDGVVTERVETVARVAVPMRDAEPVAGPLQRATARQPKGFVEGRRLDSSAIVTDVHARPEAANGAAPGARRTLGEAILSQVEHGWRPGGLRLPSGGARPERNPFDSDWAGIRRKLDEELTPDRLQSRLKAMTAGDVLEVEHGRTTVRIGAVLRRRMEYLGESGTTEFNVGTDVQRSFAHTGATGTGHQGALGAVAAVPVPAAPHVSVTAGLTGTGGRGHDRADTQARSTAAGSATKAKVPGSAYAGEAELQFTITRRPWIGAQVHRRRTATIGFEALVETGETVPVDAPAEKASDAGQLSAVALSPEPVAVRVPPERVWEGGLRDTDVLRWLGDVGGVQDLLRLRGPEYFGSSTWRELAPVVGAITSHSHLSALFGAATQGAGVTATVPSDRVTLGGGKGVEVGIKVVSLEHRAVDEKVELSPANATASGGTRYELSAQNAGLQGQLGARITGDVTHSPAVVGGAQRLWRDGGGHGDSGQVIANGKFATPMARYAGHAEVAVTLFDGARNPVREKGVVPFAVDIPLSETTGREVAGDHYLAFTRQQPGGELRAADGDWRLDEVRRVVGADGDHLPGSDGDHLLGTVRLGRALYGREFTAGTATGTAHIRATHRLVELAGGTERLAELLDAPLQADRVRRAVGWIEAAEGPVTREELVAARGDWKD
ncbi:WXG100-like domain-containing protein [Kitasatospora sp. NPDC004531]